MARKQSKQPRWSKRRVTRRVRTTLGALLAAAYDAAGCKAESAAELLSRGPLGELLVQRRLRFV